MKRTYLWLILTLLAVSCYSQIINIPDQNFKNKLLAANSANSTAFNFSGQACVIDTNGNGEIELSEAILIMHLNLNNSNITSLTGIQGFEALESLNCSFNQLTALNVSNIPSLEFLNCNNNSIEVLELAGDNITVLQCNNNLLTVLDATNVYGALYCANNLLTSLIVSDTLIEGTCANNQLATMDLSGMSECDFSLSNNLLTSVDLSGIDLFNLNLSNNLLTDGNFLFGPNSTVALNISSNLFTNVTIQAGDLNGFQCNNNSALTTIDFSGISGYTDYVIMTNNPSLQYINFKNGISDFDDVFGEVSWDLSGNNAVQYVCDDSVTTYLQTNLPSAQITTYCSFTPGGNYNTIAGSIHLDIEGNGCDASDAVAPNIALGLSNGTSLGNTYSNSVGNYQSYVASGDQTVTPQFENPYYIFSPASFTSSFTGFGNTQTADFCLSPNGIHNDLQITIAPITNASPGFNANYKLICQNRGTTIQSGSITLTYNDAVADFISSSPTTATQSTGIATWNFANLQPLAMTEILVTMHINPPTAVPPVNNGDILNFTASAISDATEETPADNNTVLNQYVVGSEDPNDKTVTEGSTIDVSQLDNYLHYVIRFQNVGSAPAVNIVVKDMLSANLDVSTLQMVSASHPYRSTLTAGNKLEFFFEDIDLPSSDADEAASHGYIAFKIKPVEGATIGTTIENRADIYFDFNFPIATNTVNTIVTQLGYNTFNVPTFTLYPNPASQSVSINCQSLNSVKIYDIIGQTIKSIQCEQPVNVLTVDISDLAIGTYFIKSVAGMKTQTGKLIKI